MVRHPKSQQPAACRSIFSTRTMYNVLNVLNGHHQSSTRRNLDVCAAINMKYRSTHSSIWRFTALFHNITAEHTSSSEYKCPEPNGACNNRVRFTRICSDRTALQHSSHRMVSIGIAKCNQRTEVPPRRRQEQRLRQGKTRFYQDQIQKQGTDIFIF